MNEFIALRAKARARRDNEIAKAREEYRANLAQIAELEQRLLGKTDPRRMRLTAAVESGMSMPRPLNSAPAIAVSIALSLLTIASIYVAFYFLLSTAEDWEDGDDGTPYRSREFHHEWQCCIFEPAAVVETFVSGREVWPVVPKPVQ